MKTSIEWTDESWNPVRGCTLYSPGCKHCFARTIAERFRGVPGHAYEQGFDLRLVPEKLSDPLRWKKPRKVFVNSMSDLFHEDVPDEYIAAVFGVMAATPQHTYQVLTKRAERMARWFEWVAGSADRCLEEAASRIDDNDLWMRTLDKQELGSIHTEAPQWPLPGVWLGVSVEDQQRADERIPHLLKVPAVVRWLSVEPQLGLVDLSRWLGADGPAADGLPCDDCGSVTDCSCEAGPARIAWIVQGGESGPGARPFVLAWARRLRDQCKAAGVPYFLKQLGRAPSSAEDRITHRGNTAAMPQGFNRFLNDKKGGDPGEWPMDLRDCRAWPEVRHA